MFRDASHRNFLHVVFHLTGHWAIIGQTRFELMLLSRIVLEELGSYMGANVAARGRKSNRPTQ